MYHNILWFEHNLVWIALICKVQILLKSRTEENRKFFIKKGYSFKFQKIKKDHGTIRL